jgi:peptide deformylase
MSSFDAIDAPLEHIRSLQLYGSPTLRAKCAEIKYYPEIKELANEMIKVMYSFGGVGLAGPQIGFPHRIIVIDLFRKVMDPLVLINPVITWKSEERMVNTEGCLSLPGFFKQVVRPINIVVDYIDIHGDKQTLKLDNPNVAENSARVIQHEIDHLDGILIIDK